MFWCLANQCLLFISVKDFLGGEKFDGEKYNDFFKITIMFCCITDQRVLFISVKDFQFIINSYWIWTEVLTDIDVDCLFWGGGGAKSAFRYSEAGLQYLHTQRSNNEEDSKDGEGGEHRKDGETTRKSSSDRIRDGTVQSGVHGPD